MSHRKEKDSFRFHLTFFFLVVFFRKKCKYFLNRKVSQTAIGSSTHFNENKKSNLLVKQINVSMASNAGFGFTLHAFSFNWFLHPAFHAVMATCQF